MLNFEHKVSKDAEDSQVKLNFEHKVSKDAEDSQVIIILWTQTWYKKLMREKASLFVTFFII